MSSLFEQLLKKRGLTGSSLKAFLNPNYDTTPDPFLMTSMKEAVERIGAAKGSQEKVLIYGDYDADGVTSTALLYDALESFGFEQIEYILPHRVKDGYGLSGSAVDKIKRAKPDLVITVDCGSSDNSEINELMKSGIDVIVTDHHQFRGEVPEAVAVINPNRPNDKYPFKQLSGVGVTFKLVQALQTKLEGLPKGQEKWLLDLVAIGTVCDCVPLVEENRVNTYYGLKVLDKTRRLGLKALVDTAGIKQQLGSSDLGFRIGPRLNAAGRLAKADQSLELLLETDPEKATGQALSLNQLNDQRKSLQGEIFKDIVSQGIDESENVLFVVSSDWHEGIIGILASKLTERYKKPTFVFTKVEDELLKGSARSFGDFSLADSIKAGQEHIEKGGGHHEAAGVTIKAKNLEAFRQAVNSYYDSLSLKGQEQLLNEAEDLEVEDLSLLDLDLTQNLTDLEPFGNGNPEPIFKLANVKIETENWLGAEKNHLRLMVSDSHGNELKLMSFYGSDSYKGKLANTHVDIWITLNVNEWNGRKSVEGRLIRLQIHTG